MLIYVMPGEVPGNPLALTNELHRLRYVYGVQAIVDAGDDTPATLLAREWAQRRNIPAITGQQPDTVVIPTDMTQVFGEETGEDEFRAALESMESDAWNQALNHIRPETPGRLRRILNALKAKRPRQTVWVNTTCETYTSPEAA